MSLVANDLRDAIIAEVDALSDEDKANQLSVQGAWADAIRTYITDNLEVGGAYVGVLSGAPPPADPLSGSYTWGVTSFVLTGAMLVAGSSSFATWVLVLDTAIKAITMSGADTGGAVTTAPGLVLAPFVLNLTQADLSEGTDRDTVIGLIAAKICDSLLATTVSGITSVATSTSPGTGTVTYTALE
jgi:hypothetical protein